MKYLLIVIAVLAVSSPAHADPLAAGSPLAERISAASQICVALNGYLNGQATSGCVKGISNIAASDVQGPLQLETLCNSEDNLAYKTTCYFVAARNSTNSNISDAGSNCQFDYAIDASDHELNRRLGCVKSAIDKEASNLQASASSEMTLSQCKSELNLAVQLNAQNSAQNFIGQSIAKPVNAIATSPVSSGGKPAQ